MARKRLRYRESAVAGGLNAVVIPLLDLSFQLLFFFVVNYRPGIEEGKIDCGLAGVSGSKEPVEAVGHELDLPDRIEVVVKQSGGLDHFVVITPEGEWALADLPAVSRFLAERRRAVGKAGPIQVAGQGGLKYGRVVEVVDACRKAGYERVALAHAPDA